jgi:hypothetical protein
MSMAQITQAAESLRAAEAAYNGKIAAINAAVATKSAEVDAFLLTAREKLTAPIGINFNPQTIHSKTSRALAVDPANNTRTVWAAVNQMDSQSYAYSISELTHFAMLSLPRSYASFPGFFENPQYGVDKSVSEMDFVVASIGSTSEQINAALNLGQIVPGVAATWSFASVTIKVPIVKSIQAETGFLLFQRFRNRFLRELPGADPATPPQPIATFGGNSSFAISNLNIFRK